MTASAASVPEDQSRSTVHVFVNVGMETLPHTIARPLLPARLSVEGRYGARVPVPHAAVVTTAPEGCVPLNGNSGDRPTAGAACDASAPSSIGQYATGEPATTAR